MNDPLRLHPWIGDRCFMAAIGLTQNRHGFGPGTGRRHHDLRQVCLQGNGFAKARS